MKYDVDEFHQLVKFSNAGHERVGKIAAGKDSEARKAVKY